MKRSIFFLLGLCFVGVVMGGEPPGTPEPLLPRCHSHNDYEHPRPLEEALELGFGSVEADIFLVDGNLQVGHERSQLRSDRTLESLYLEPLWRRTEQGRKRVYPSPGPLILMIDIKTDAEKTYLVLRNILKGYGKMFCSVRQDQVSDGSVKVILSGNRPGKILEAECQRWAFMDGRVEDLGRGYSVAYMPWISDDWKKFFTWQGEGEMESKELARMRRMISEVHLEGKQLRFWGYPNRVEVWKVLKEEGVDFINADELGLLRTFWLKSN